MHIGAFNKPLSSPAPARLYRVGKQINNLGLPHDTIVRQRGVFRGGSWDTMAKYCRSAFRDYNVPSGNFSSVGFRVVLVP
ncbi:MAG: hypothetical protein KA753_03185 [Paludibacter sp.]|nr:hypothetical protein [Paludibacter sp.]